MSTKKSLLINQLLKKTIKSKMPVDSQTNANYILAMARIAQDAESTKRFYALTDQTYTSEIVNENTKIN